MLPVRILKMGSLHLELHMYSIISPADATNSAVWLSAHDVNRSCPAHVRYGVGVPVFFFRAKILVKSVARVMKSSA